MQKRIVLAAVCVFTACAYGCAKDGGDAPKVKTSGMSPHGSSSSQASQGHGFIGIITARKLPEFESKTIGAAFEEYRYFNSREWSETRNAAGKVYVDFKGLFAVRLLDTDAIKNGVARQGVEIKFVVEPNGNLYVGMVSRIEVKTDGKMYLYPREDGKAIMEMIYSNREIRF